MATLAGQAALQRHAAARGETTTAPATDVPGTLSTGQDVHKFENWVKFVGYQVVNAAITALCVWIGVITANPLMIGASILNGAFQAGLIFADWSHDSGQVSHVTAMNSTMTSLSVVYLTHALKSGLAGLSIFGGIFTAVLYGMQLYHLDQRNS